LNLPDSPIHAGLSPEKGPRNLRVHLIGGEGTGWALDADAATTTAALARCRVSCVTMQQADVVHAVWENSLLTLPISQLAGKRLICHLPNDVVYTWAQGCMARSAHVGRWIAHSRKAERDCEAIGMPAIYIPQAVDVTVFDANRVNEDPDTLRLRWGLPIRGYIISNFMRDSSAANLLGPKAQKGVELFLDIVVSLKDAGLPIHVLLAGPRRHWIRRELSKRDIPFTFVGKVVEGDDNHINILPPETINLLYHASDLHLVTSRWEGGPRAVLEAAATRTKIMCTPVGLAPDVLEPTSIFRSASEAIERIADDIRTNALDPTIEPQHRRVLENHTPAANAVRFQELYDRIDEVPVFRPHGNISLQRTPAPSRLKDLIAAGMAPFWGRPRHQPGHGLCVCLWHEFHKPPYGGGNQFMLALRTALSRRGVRIRVNDSSKADIHLCNSAWFSVDALRVAIRNGESRMVHRIDGPVSLYRNTDRAEDDRIFMLNQELATATVFQSFWCYARSLSLGYKAEAPIVIHNAVDGRIFYPPRRRSNRKANRIRLISSAWSDNPRKGLDVFSWLDENLDFNRFEYTFVGRVKAQFRNIRLIPPQSSKSLAAILREHDVFVSASRSEPCSNALIEAMACGLPALYMNDGGNPELVQFGGIPFTGTHDILGQLDELAQNLEHLRAAVYVAPIDQVALSYIDLFKMAMDLPAGRA
jgi:glycosyltransferase involved in cell wall biosynthesis